MGRTTYIFAGGGSGGHLYPGIAIAEELRRRNPAAECRFVGSARPLEQTILASTPFEHHALPVEPLSLVRKSPIQFLRRNWRAWRDARQLLANEHPAWVIGLGGYISVPTVWAARRRGIPILLIEQNAVPGAATRWLAGMARHIALTFDEARAHLPRHAPIMLTGNPLRGDILAIAQHSRPETEHSPKTLLILGGSQGAESLNRAVVAALAGIQTELRGWRIVHQTGAGRAAAISEAYRQHSIPATVADFFPKIAQWYAEADLVISRSGATTLAELACLGCPSILVPYPFAADHHQRANARAFVNRDAAVMVEQAATSDETERQLREPLATLLTNDNRRLQLGQAARTFSRLDATQVIADLLSPPAPSTPSTLSRRDEPSRSVVSPHQISTQELVS